MIATLLAYLATQGMVPAVDDLPPPRDPEQIREDFRTYMHASADQVCATVFDCDEADLVVLDQIATLYGVDLRVLTEQLRDTKGARVLDQMLDAAADGPLVEAIEAVQAWGNVLGNLLRGRRLRALAKATDAVKETIDAVDALKDHAAERREKRAAAGIHTVKDEKGRRGKRASAAASASTSTSASNKAPNHD